MKQNFSLSGMRDFSSFQLKRREYILSNIKNQFILYGFLPISTPIMEKRNNLFGNYNQEGEKLIFQVLKSGDYLSSINKENYEDTSSNFSRLISDKALRYDLTLPFARFVSQNRSSLNFPFRKYQIGPVFRADRPQKGRLREFLQCDVDIIGSQSLWSEVDLLCLIDSVFKSLSLKSIKIKLNHRKILEGLFESFSLNISFDQFCILIDKFDKIGIDKLIALLIEKGCTKNEVSILNTLFLSKGSFLEKKSIILNLVSNNNIKNGLDDISFILDQLKTHSVYDNIEFDISLARGLDYYTGSIFEVISLENNTGSLLGGGRYDELAEKFGFQNISGVGMSFGLDRIYDLIDLLDLFPQHINNELDFLFINFGIKESSICHKYILELRSLSYSTELYPDDIKVNKQMNYANNRGAKFVIMIGEEELSLNKIKVKNMATGKQSVLSFSEFIKTFPRDESKF
jgi:histidyl-tRNA synthetase